MLTIDVFSSFQVESELKSLSYVDNICVHGDSFQNYIVGLIIPNPNAIRPLAKKLGLDDKAPLPDLYSNPLIEKEVLSALKIHAVKAGLHKSEIPQKIKLCPEEWTPDTGLVTAALKIRRKQIKDFYQRDIDRMYSDNTGDHSNNNNVITNGKSNGVRNGHVHLSNQAAKEKTP